MCQKWASLPPFQTNEDNLMWIKHTRLFFFMLTGSKWRNTFFLSLPGHPQYTGSVQQDFENTNISLPLVAFLSDDIKNQLQDISIEAKKFDFTAIMQQVCLFLCGSLTVIRWLCVYMLK